jgi:glycosyltransferase involved in cell wall biosynthesis
LNLAISIIIPTYNYAAFLPRAVASCLQQTYLPKEIIIVDDGSTDDTPTILAQWQQNPAYTSLIKYIRRTNQGPGAARNVGASQAQGQWLVFLDADDELLPTALAEFAQAALSTPTIDAWLADSYRVHAGQVPEYDATADIGPDLIKNCYDFLLHRKYSAGTSGRLMIKQAVFSQLGYAEHVKNGEDIPFMAWLLANYPCKRLTKGLVYSYRHEASLRHQAHLAPESLLQIVDTIFDSPLLPASLTMYKERYRSLRLYELAKVYIKACNPAAAKQALQQAAKSHLYLVTKLAYWKCWMKCYLFKKK